jgi:hypothetical protein
MLKIIYFDFVRLQMTSQNIVLTKEVVLLAIVFLIRCVTNFPECPRKSCITCSLMVAVTFGVVFLRTNTLSESMFPLLKTFMELIFRNAAQDGRRTSLNIGNI